MPENYKKQTSLQDEQNFYTDSVYFEEFSL